MSIQEIEHRLNSWSYYIFDLFNNKIGWPAESLNLFVIGAPRFSATVPLIKYDACQQIDLWIRQMGQEYPQYQEVVYHYYLNRAPLNVVAKSMNLSVRRMQERLHQAKIWLCGRLTAHQSTNAL